MYVFVGGFGDGVRGHRIVYDYAQQFSTTHPGVHYFNWDEHDAIIERINGAGLTETVMAIGHSYGGDTVGNIVAHLHRRITLLVTVDPVGHTGRSAYQLMKANASTWVDVNAKPPGWANLSNWIAGIGNSWGDDVKDLATYYIEAPYNHEQFSQLMIAQGDVGVSAASVLDRAGRGGTP